MAHKMGLFTSSMVFLSILVSGVHGLNPKSLGHWKEKLPNTPADAKKPSDPWSLLFFHEKDLHVGTKKLLYLGKGSKTEEADFLPRHLSDKIPFSSDKLSVALKDLNIPEGSEVALGMKNTITQCEQPPIMGESRYCVTSVESMVDYAISTLGTDHLNVLVNNGTKNSVTQYFTFTGIPFHTTYGSKAVVCHPQVYPYAVFFCHQAKNTKQMKISLTGEDGTTAEGVAVCHGDTSEWNPNHMSFKVLNIKPGEAAVCHFIPEGHVVWVPAN